MADKYCSAQFKTGEELDEALKAALDTCDYAASASECRNKAQEHRTAAEAAAADAQQYVTMAEEAAVAVEQAASRAGEAKEAAETAVLEAQQQVEQAEDYARTAGESADEATTAASNAKKSLNAAEDEAAAAKYHAEQAAGSATAAETSKNYAQSSAEAASAAAERAVEHDNAAAIAKGYAEGYANTAVEKANEAKGYAEEAASRASAASLWSTTAQGFATKAQEYAEEAKNAAGSGATSWDDLGTHGTGEVVEIFPQTRVYFEPDGTSASGPLTEELVEGMTYEVYLHYNNNIVNVTCQAYLDGTVCLRGEFKTSEDGEAEEFLIQSSTAFFGAFTITCPALASESIPINIEKIDELIVPIPEKYLPKNIGGVSSWNDLTDKPFGVEGTGERVEILPETKVNFDDGGLANISRLTEAFVAGNTYVVVLDPNSYADEFTCVASLNSSGAVTLSGTMPVSEIGTTADFVLTGSASDPTDTYASVYCPYFAGRGRYLAIYRLDETVTPLPEMYLPDCVVKHGDTELILSSSDGKRFRITVDTSGNLSAVALS